MQQWIPTGKINSETQEQEPPVPLGTMVVITTAAYRGAPLLTGKIIQAIDWRWDQRGTPADIAFWRLANRDEILEYIDTISDAHRLKLRPIVGWLKEETDADA